MFLVIGQLDLHEITTEFIFSGVERKQCLKISLLNSVALDLKCLLKLHDVIQYLVMITYYLHS